MQIEYKAKIFLIFVLIIGFVSPAYAETYEGIPKSLVLKESRRRITPISLRAEMAADEVASRFGSPDKKVIEDESNKESWYYGGAVVFFSNNVVTAWSDNGVLKDREALAKIQGNHGGEVDVFYKGGWLNAWTPQTPLSHRRMLDEVLNGFTKKLSDYWSSKSGSASRLSIDGRASIKSSFMASSKRLASMPFSAYFFSSCSKLFSTE